MKLFSPENINKKLFPPRTERLNHRPFDKTICGERTDSSLNKNTIYQPKKIKGLTFLKNDNEKNVSLPKTASTSQNTTETVVNPLIDKKQISKELLSQIHFCRFVFKLIQRMGIKLRGKINKELKESMCGMIF